MVCFCLSLAALSKLVLPPIHFRSEVTQCCRDYFCKQRSYCMCNMTTWIDGLNFFAKMDDQLWFWRGSHGPRPVNPYTNWKLMKRRICCILGKSQCEGCEKSYRRSKKTDKNRISFVTKGGATVLQLNSYTIDIKYYFILGTNQRAVNKIYATLFKSVLSSKK